jgi:hypothetical protein
MTASDAEAEAARAEVDEAETALVSGKRNVSADALHKLRDAWRHADLRAQSEKAKAERAQVTARLKGLEEIGTQADRLADGPGIREMTEALEAVSSACRRVCDLAAQHDADVAALVAAAIDLGAEPMAPGGPRKTSAHVAVDGDTIAHGRTVLRPVSGQVLAALGRAQIGAPSDAAAMLHAVETLREPKRPDHLLRGRGGVVLTVFGEPDVQMYRQIQSGDLESLPGSAIDAYMEGELQ